MSEPQVWVCVWLVAFVVICSTLALDRLFRAAAAALLAVANKLDAEAEEVDLRNDLEHEKRDDLIH